jgi:hypothetical protein
LIDNEEQDAPRSQYRILDKNIEEDAEQIAERIKERYKGYARGDYKGDTDHVPQSVLIPSINDPKLWLVSCKVFMLISQVERRISCLLSCVNTLI